MPSHNLPQPNRAFVGRTAELEAFGKALAGTGRSAITQPQAITGLGDIGKTQLALHYAYAHLADYDLIRWLSAEEPAVLTANYTGIANSQILQWLAYHRCTWGKKPGRYEVE